MEGWFHDINPETGRNRWRTAWATIWESKPVDHFGTHFTWHTWDANGTGGENSVEPTLEEAQEQATIAAIRQEFVKIVLSDDDPSPQPTEVKG